MKPRRAKCCCICPSAHAVRSDRSSGRVNQRRFRLGTNEKKKILACSVQAALQSADAAADAFALSPPRVVIVMTCADTYRVTLVITAVRENLG
jgi:hypothetical protein